ncbi:MAG: class I SAM-dependent methyltransferase [Pyrinomonadaceae bacterium]|nr:class I SAM-dependent methyltransferase [Acidobacteriota bacterium]
MKNSQDAYGRQLLAQYHSRTKTAEIIERDDGFIDTGSDAGTYFREYKQWSPPERRAIKWAKGRVLDIGCGAGRHSLYLQQNGFDVTGIDISPGAIKVCKLRGLKKALVRPITDVDKFKPNSFDTIIMFGNNFGLFGSAKAAKLILKKLHRITSPDARIIAGTLNPYQTGDTDHLEYHKLNRRRGRMPGQIRMRVRYRRAIGAWFDYLFVAPNEMEDIFTDTNWRIEKLIAPEEANYFAVIRKSLLPNSGGVPAFQQFQYPQEQPSFVKIKMNRLKR